MFIHDVIKNGIKVAEISFNSEPSQLEIAKAEAPYLQEPYTPTQKEKDFERYTKRSVAKNAIITEMATENMGRIRSGEWSTADVISLTQDTQLQLVLADVHSLSFELAAMKLSAATNPLITTAIKNTWIQRLQAHFYL
jgi:hypothetical protein